MNHFKGRHFQKDIILVAVGYYFRFSLSYRDIVELLRDRGITVHHTTVMRWVHHYGPIFKAIWRRHQTAHAKSWRIDETYIRVKGRWAYLYRAIDSNGLTMDFELRNHRDYTASYHFLKRLLTTNSRPDRLVTDQYRATLKAVKHQIPIRQSLYSTNLIENFNKHLKRTTHHKEQFPTEDSLDRFLVSQFNVYNEKSLKRIHRGFKRLQDTLEASFI